MAARGIYIMPRNGEMPERPWRMRTRRETIPSVGAIHPPQVLQQSEIGPMNILERASVEIKVELLRVSSNYQDHMVYSTVWDCKNPQYLSSSCLLGPG